MIATIAASAWLGDARLQKVLGLLNRDGEEARIAGGAVRNALFGEAVSDIDIATTCLPEETVRRAAAAGLKTAPTGIEHGTVTVIADGHPFEVTTLRRDIETDGRRAKVRFGRDWRADAERRDFTINGLYAEADGTVIDLVGGVADIESRTLRFIGDAETRIREDYLRILRFFRFFAWYGDGRPDAEGLRACTRLKPGLSGLSAERVWSELRKLLTAPDPSRALLWMRQTGVLTSVLPESEKWGIDAIHGLVATEKALGWMADPLLRLEAMVPRDAARMGELGRRLKLSNADMTRLAEWADGPAIGNSVSDSAMAKLLYRNGASGPADQLRLALASARTRGIDDDSELIAAGAYGRLLKLAQDWTKPVFPIAGKDLLTLGFEPGEELGKLLARLEQEWVEAGFMPDRDALLARAQQLARKGDGTRPAS
ncbi:MAG: CCA tRNA nucleotidyltransferase [Rhizobiaceae bacterium]